MRLPFTTADARERGISKSALEWGVRRGRWVHVARGVYIEGPELPTPLERAVAEVFVTSGVASGTLAASLLGFDGISLCVPYVTVPQGLGVDRTAARRRALQADAIITVDGVRCTDRLHTMLDLATALDDLAWEQALESALRKKMVTISDLVAALHKRRVGNTRIRRVLALRPDGAPPTESVLETLMVQLIRTESALPEPLRQVEVHDVYGRFVARVDLAWPDVGLFIELDGEHHKGQPLYDARRETAIVAATSWLPGRFTWSEVVFHKRATTRRLVGLRDAASRRPHSVARPA